MEYGCCLPCQGFLLKWIALQWSANAVLTRAYAMSVLSKRGSAPICKMTKAKSPRQSVPRHVRVNRANTNRTKTSKSNLASLCKGIIQTRLVSRNLFRKFSRFAAETFAVCVGNFHASEPFTVVEVCFGNFHGLLRKISLPRTCSTCSTCNTCSICCACSTCSTCNTSDTCNTRSTCSTCTAKLVGLPRLHGLSGLRSVKPLHRASVLWLCVWYANFYTYIYIYINWRQLPLSAPKVCEGFAFLRFLHLYKTITLPKKQPTQTLTLKILPWTEKHPKQTLTPIFFLHRKAT